MKKGNIEIRLPRKEQVQICCSRVGKLQNEQFILEKDFAECEVNLNVLNTAEQLANAAARLEAYVEGGFLIQTDEEGIARLQELEEGVYLLNSLETVRYGEQKIVPTLLYLPSWDSVEEKMSYDITVIPKYGVGNPATGDSSKLTAWIPLLFLSAVFLGYKIKKTLKKEKCF